MTTSASQTVLITGANSGIGKAVATALARRDWHVFATARSAERGQAAVSEIRQESGSNAVELLELDLSSFASVRRAAAEFLDRSEQLDALVNNAGVILSDRTLTEDGLESTMQVNHFGHFLLTSLLLPTVLQSAEPCVINVSSIVHQRAERMPLDDLSLERRWGAVYPYAVSKLANVLFTRELHRRFANQNLATFAVHPGGVRTGFGRDGDYGGLMGRLMPLVRPLMMSPSRGAAPIVELVVDAGHRAHAGAYYNRHKRQDPSSAAQRDDDAMELWERSVELTDAS